MTCHDKLQRQVWITDQGEMHKTSYHLDMSPKFGYVIKNFPITP